MGGIDVAAGAAVLEGAGVPTFPYPDNAARVWTFVARYAADLEALYETPMMVEEAGLRESRSKAKSLLAGIREEGRTLLNEAESKQLLSLYGIPTVETRVATDADEAVAAAKMIGFPVVMKIHSNTVTHKSDVGGVKLGLSEPSSVRAAFGEIRDSVLERVGKGHFLGVTVQPMINMGGIELILGSTLDSQFGPCLLFGTGGTLVEVFRDKALELPPLNSNLARRMIERTVIFKALKGVRGAEPVDMELLLRTLVRFSQLIVEQPWIKEVDMNPIVAAPGLGNILALDARVVLRSESEGPGPTAAIRPYPSEYAWVVGGGGGWPLTVRAVRAADEPAMMSFFHQLSQAEARNLLFSPFGFSGESTEHMKLASLCCVDYSRQITLVAIDSSGTMRGMARMAKIGDTDAAMLGIAAPGREEGLGDQLLAKIMQVARKETVVELRLRIIPEPPSLSEMLVRSGVVLEEADAHGLVKGRLSL